MRRIGMSSSGRMFWIVRIMLRTNVYASYVEDEYSADMEYNHAIANCVP